MNYPTIYWAWWDVKDLLEYSPISSDEAVLALRCANDGDWPAAIHYAGQAARNAPQAFTQMRDAIFFAADQKTVDLNAIKRLCDEGLDWLDRARQGILSADRALDAAYRRNWHRARIAAATAAVISPAWQPLYEALLAD